MASLVGAAVAATMPDSPYEGQMLVCVFGPWCRLDGGADTHKALKSLAKEAGMASRVRVTKSGCLGQCGHGPVVACWPENVWYAHVKPEDARELFDAHVLRGEPLERLRYRPEKPGTNKTAEVLEKEKAGSGAE
jgi:(2Fe-2S) ferredoxin